MLKRITRRRFIGTGAACLASTVLLAGCNANHRHGKVSGLPPADDDIGDDDDGGALGPDGVLLGLYTANSAATPEEAVRLVLQGLDWSWLSTGDSVLIKVACNSGKLHPSVTSPASVRAVASELFKRGAGRVLVADQSGVEYVRSADGGRRFGQTRGLMQSNGLLQAIVDAGAEPWFFDEQDYDAGYFEASLPFSDQHWDTPPHVPAIIRDVDHIVYLPRLSSHMIAGYTHGHKCAIGWLRDDSRHQLHFKADSLHEKFVEVNYCSEIRDRHRLTVTLAEQLLLDAGPDAGTIAEPDQWIVLASPHLANHDALSVAALAYVDDKTPASGAGLLTPYGNGSDLYNRGLLAMIPILSGIPWTSDAPGGYTQLAIHDYQAGIASDRALTRAYEILGGVPASISVRLMGEEPAQEFRNFLEAFNNRIFDLVVS